MDMKRKIQLLRFTLGNWTKTSKFLEIFHNFNLDKNPTTNSTKTVPNEIYECPFFNLSETQSMTEILLNIC